MAQYEIDDEGELTKITLETGEESIVLPPEVRSIANGVINQELPIREITIGENVRVKESAFYNNGTCRKITIGEGTYFESGAFAFVNPIDDLRGPSSGEYIVSGGLITSGDTVLLGSNQKEILIPEGITTIGSKAFAGCKGIEKVSIPKTTTRIDSYAFCDCTGITEVDIPITVREIGEGAFAGCKNVRLLRIGEGEAEGDQSQGLSLIRSVFMDMGAVEVVKLPQYVSEISNSVGEDAFHNDNSIVHCIIPEEGWKPDRGNLPIAQDYPNGTNPITVTFDPNGGTVSIRSKDVYIGTPYGYLPEPTGYLYHEFIGWFWNNEQITEQTMVLEEGNRTLVAEWNPSVFSVKFFWSDGETIYYEVQAPYGSNVDIPENPPPHKDNPDDFVFLCWEDQYGNKVTGNIVTVKSSNLYYPKYEPREGIFKIRVISAEEHTAEISGIYDGLPTDIVRDLTIPFVITKKNVTYYIIGIGNAAFRGNSEIDVVKAESGIRYVGREAFQDSTIRTLIIPWCDIIKANAFRRAYNLSLLSSPDSEHSYDTALLLDSMGVQEIGEGAFRECSRDTIFSTIDIFYETHNIGNYAFYGIRVNTLYAQYWPHAIPYKCFANSEISTIVGSFSDQSVEDGAFENASINTFYFAGYAVDPYIGNKAFANSSVSEVITRNPEQLDTSVGKDAFRGSYIIRFIKYEDGTLTEGVVLGYIGDGAFYGCGNLGMNEGDIEIPIGPKTRYIGKNSFHGIYPTNYLNYSEKYDPETGTYKIKHAFRGVYIVKGWIVEGRPSSNPDVTEFDFDTMDNGEASPALTGIASRVFDGGSEKDPTEADDNYFVNLTTISFPSNVNHFVGQDLPLAFCLSAGAVQNFRRGLTIYFRSYFCRWITITPKVDSRGAVFVNTTDLTIHCLPSDELTAKGKDGTDIWHESIKFLDGFPTPVCDTQFTLYLTTGDYPYSDDKPYVVAWRGESYGWCLGIQRNLHEFEFANVGTLYVILGNSAFQIEGYYVKAGVRIPAHAFRGAGSWARRVN